MPEKVVPGPVCDDRSIREAVCIHTRKIFDSCRDKDCVEDLRVYPTRCSQEVIDRAQSIKAGTAELLFAYIDVEPVTFNRGFFTVDVRYFYRITADAFVGAARPVQVCGLAVFSKRAVLFGSESGSKSFTSEDNENQVRCVPQSSLPTAVVEAVIYPKLPDKLKRNLSVIRNGGRDSASVFNSGGLPRLGDVGPLLQDFFIVPSQPIDALNCQHVTGPKGLDQLPVEWPVKVFSGLLFNNNTVQGHTKLLQSYHLPVLLLTAGGYAGIAVHHI